VLDERSERSRSGSETGHDDRLGVERRKLSNVYIRKRKISLVSSASWKDKGKRAERTFITEGLMETVTCCPTLRPAM
jgi:hypothetical protein